MKHSFSINRSLVMLLIVTGIFFQTACSSSKSVHPSANRKEVKGRWLLDSINYDGLVAGAKYNIGLLDEGSAKCLKGSTWVLPNNGYGSYSLVASDAACKPGERKIVWSYRTENDQTIFQYKVLEDGVKAKKITEGYRFKIISADENRMHLQQEITSDGKMVYINYQFASIK